MILDHLSEESLSIWFETIRHALPQGAELVNTHLHSTERINVQIQYGKPGKTQWLAVSTHDIVSAVRSKRLGDIGI